jgi:serine/threonine protein kinase
MEQAPPPPLEKGVTPQTPQLYMTPQWAKRRDGLCPSLLNMDSKMDSSRSNPGGHNKPYQTNSNLLLQCKEEATQLQSLVETVSSAIKKIVSTKAGSEITSVRLVPQGITWKLVLTNKDAEQSYKLRVNVAANERDGLIHYYIDTILSPKKVDSNSLAATPKGYAEAKSAFDALNLVVRKAVVGLEFPEFPEGCKGQQFREVYQLNARLKSGSFATVCRGTHRATGRKVAIKCVLRKDLPPADDAAIYDEVAILASLNHPHIVPLIDFFDEKDCYFIVMELMSGGDLFDRIGTKKAYSEADARDLIVKMLKAVSYCHARKIAHCDMKPKNLLLMSDDNDSFIKLADFGFAARVHEPKCLSKQCGTPFFVSPEILMRKGYDQQSDMWSVGCIVYLLLSGNLPFMGRTQKELFRKIVSGKYEFVSDDWKDVSDDAKDLVQKLLVSNPDSRITANEAVRHKWLKASRDRLGLIMLQGTSQRLKTFNARMKLRSAMIAVDWISSLKRMSWMSSRNLEEVPASENGSSAYKPNPMLMARMQKAREEREARERAVAAAAAARNSPSPKPSDLHSTTRRMKSDEQQATQGMKSLSFK